MSPERERPRAHAEPPGGDEGPGWPAALLAGLGAIGLGALFVSVAPVASGVLARVASPLPAAMLVIVASLGTTTVLRAALGRIGLAGPRSPTTPSHVALDVVVGFPLFGTACFLVGLLSTGPLAMGALLAAMAAVGLWSLRRVRVVSVAVEPSAIALVGALLAGLGLGVGASLALLPVASLDELAYHLAVPHQWAIEGRVVELPLISHAYFPFGVESTSLPLFALLGPSGALASHLACALLALATAKVAFDLVAQGGSRAAAWVGLAALTTTPALAFVMGKTLTEWGLIGACLVLIAALRDPEARRVDVALAIAAGLATKYTFAPFAIVVLIAFVITSRDRRGALSTSARPVVAGALLGGVFFLRNLAWTANPIAPFGEPDTPHVAFFGAGRSAADLLTRYVYHAEMVDESLGLALAVAALPLVVAWRALRRDPYLLGLTVGLVLSLAALLTLEPVGRVLTPQLVALALVGLLASGRGARLVHVSVLGSAALQALLLGSLFAYLDPLTTVSTDALERRYLERERSSYDAARWIDAQLPAESLTLVLGMQETYSFTHRVRGGGNFDGPRIARYLDAGSPEVLRSRLEADGFDHVAVHRAHLVVGTQATEGLAAERNTVLTEAQAAVLRAFLDTHTTAIGMREESAVYRLNP